MNTPTENPAQRTNAATGSNKRLGKQLDTTSPERQPLVKPSLTFSVMAGHSVSIPDNTRLADVASKLALSGAAGISALDFPQGVRLGGLIHILRKKGMPVTTTRERVASDPFSACRAVYRTPVQVVGGEAV